MSRRWIYSLCLAASACSTLPADTPHTLRSGIDMQYVDSGVRPQDDTYEHLNGQWLKEFQIPPDKATYGATTAIDDVLQVQLRGIVEGLPQTGDDADTRKLADLYASFMDESRIESLNLQPLMPEFAAIDAMPDKSAIPLEIARMNRIGAGAPFDFGVGQDPKNSTQYAVQVTQSGLGMPDRDYYLKDEMQLKNARIKYLVHIEKMLSMAGEPKAAEAASSILALETELAKLQWTRVENRNPLKTYNKVAIGELHGLMPAFDWPSYVSASGIGGRADFVIIRQPTYFTALDRVIGATPLPVWKAYFKWHVLSAMAPYLSKAFVDERFAFSSTVLRGIPENRPRWKRGLSLIDGTLGEALGKRYVEKYFPPQSKARMDAMVKNLLEAYRLDIETLDWMSPETRVGARAKLAKVVPKIGYPSEWRDYSALRISRDDLLGNVFRADEFEYQRNLNKLGKPIDRNEWFMNPQTVNAYYNPTANEIVFPAAFLQPPFFDPTADDAANYGGIVAVIGHEMSHGFDDRGSQYDGDGNLHDWFTKADHDKFAAKTKALVAQYSAYEPVPDYHLNGELTLGENIGDNSGLAIAFKAYQLSLGGGTAPLIDGLTGEQRFYYGWVQAWRGKAREAEVIQRIKTDPHSPFAVRGSAPLRNQAGFYAAFAVKKGDKMYLPPQERVDIW